MTTLAAQFAGHVDRSDRRHRLVLLDPSHLRCHDCAQTIDLRTGFATVPGSTSTSQGIPRPDQACPRHPGEWPDTCGRCRSERIGRHDDERPVVPQPTADVSTRGAECRAALADLAARRRESASA